MASLTNKLYHFATNGRIRRAYCYWKWRRATHQPALISLPNACQAVATDKFNDFYSIYLQHPRDEELLTYKYLLGSGGVFVDVGANMGLTTVLAHATGLADKIIAFEPSHSYASVWHQNVARNRVNNAALLQCAVGEATGSFEFIVNPRAPLHNRLNIGDTFRRYPPYARDETRIEKVPTVTLDSMSEFFGLDSIALLKIDVEGAEPFVLRGAQRLLRERLIRAMLIEFIPEFMSEMGVAPGDFVDYTQNFGYYFHRIEKDGRLGARLNRDDVIERRFEGLNVALLPDK